MCQLLYTWHWGMIARKPPGVLHQGSGKEGGRATGRGPWAMRSMLVFVAATRFAVHG